MFLLKLIFFVAFTFNPYKVMLLIMNISVILTLFSNCYTGLGDSYYAEDI